MIKGVVNARYEALVQLRLRGPNGHESHVDAIVDSGFTSSLTLPQALISSLELNRESASSAVLADGSVRQFDVFAADVLWDGVWRTVLISAIGNESLIGMRLLAGYKLVIEVMPEGAVGISVLS